MINSIVAPLVTNVTLYPNQTNAATNHRNQLTAQFEVLRASTNTELQKLNSVTDGSSGADQIKMTPITTIGAANTVQSVVEANAVNPITATDLGEATYSAGVFTTTLASVTDYYQNRLFVFKVGDSYDSVSADLSLKINALDAKGLYKHHIDSATGVVTLVRVKVLYAEILVIARYNEKGQYFVMV